MTRPGIEITLPALVVRAQLTFPLHCTGGESMAAPCVDVFSSTNPLTLSTRLDSNLNPAHMTSPSQTSMSDDGYEVVGTRRLQY